MVFVSVSQTSWWNVFVFGVNDPYTLEDFVIKNILFLIS